MGQTVRKLGYETACVYAKKILTDPTTTIDRPRVRKLAKRVMDLTNKRSNSDRVLRRDLRAAQQRMKQLNARWQIAESDNTSLRKQVRALEYALRRAQG